MASVGGVDAKQVDIVYICAYTGRVDVEWDPAKARSNLKKHGVDFADAAVALEDELALTVEDFGQVDEQRFVSLCMDPLARLIIVVYTCRDDALRIISARKATGTETRRYKGES